MKRSPILLIILAVLTCVAGGSYALFSYIPQKLEQQFTHSFQELGFEKVTYESKSQSRGKITFRNISLDPRSFSEIKSITIRYSVINFFWSGGRASSVTLDGLHLTGELSENFDLIIAGWKQQNDLLGLLTRLPMQTLAIENSTIDLMSEKFGGIKLNYNTQIRNKNKNYIEIVGKTDSTQRKLAFHATFSGSIIDQKKLDLKLDAEQIQLIWDNTHFKRGTATIMVNSPIGGKTNFSIEAGSGSMVWNGLPFGDVRITCEKALDNYNINIDGKAIGVEAIEFTSNINHVEHVTSFETMVYPQTLSNLVDFLLSNNIIPASVNIPQALLDLQQPILSFSNAPREAHDDEPTDEQADDNGHKNIGMVKLLITEPSLEMEGHYTIENNGDISGSLSTQPVRIELSMATEGDNDPRPPKSFLELMATANFTHAYDKDKKPDVNWSFDTQVTSGHLEYGFIKFDEIEGNFTYRNGDKNRNDYETLSFKLPLKSFIEQTGRIYLDFNKSPFIREIALFLYGGKIRTQGFTLEDGTIPNSLRLVVSDIKISDLLSDAGINGITIVGKIGGMLPLEIVRDKIKVKGGILQSQSPGIVHIPESFSEAIFPGPRLQMQKMRRALENYHYEYFEARFDGDLEGGVMVTLTARGFNPDMPTKDPVDLNFQIETDISTLFSSLIR